MRFGLRIQNRLPRFGEFGFERPCPLGRVGFGNRFGGVGFGFGQVGFNRGFGHQRINLDKVWAVKSTMGTIRA